MWGGFTAKYAQGAKDTGIVIVYLGFPFQDYSKHGSIIFTKKEQADEFVQDLQYMIDHWNEDSLTNEIRIDREQYRMAFVSAVEQDLMIGDAERSDYWSKLERRPAIKLLDFIRTQSKKLP